MKTRSIKLLSELEEQLQFLNLEMDDQIKCSEIAIGIILKSIKSLRSLILSSKFSNETEEIYFFKNLKPRFVSKLIYYNRILNIETKKPHGGEKIVRKYLNNELDKLKRYFDDNIDFYRYYRTNSNYLDHKYFLRNKHDIKLSLDSFYFESDHRFTTPHDYKVAKIIAHDLVQVYLEEKLNYLGISDKRIKPQDNPKFSIQWTDSKTALIELIYALHTHGSFDNGKADIKNIAAIFEQVFDIQLGDYYRTYLEIRIRKTGRTKFLSSLQETLLKRMDEADEK